MQLRNLTEMVIVPMALKTYFQNKETLISCFTKHVEVRIYKKHDAKKAFDKTIFPSVNGLKDDLYNFATRGERVFPAKILIKIEDSWQITLIKVNPESKHYDFYIISAVFKKKEKKEQKEK